MPPECGGCWYVPSWSHAPVVKLSKKDKIGRYLERRSFVRNRAPSSTCQLCTAENPVHLAVYLKNRSKLNAGILLYNPSQLPAEFVDRKAMAGWEKNTLRSSPPREGSKTQRGRRKKRRNGAGKKRKKKKGGRREQKKSPNERPSMNNPVLPPLIPRRKDTNAPYQRADSHKLHETNWGMMISCRCMFVIIVRIK